MFNVSYPKKPLPPNQKSSKENPQTSQQRSSPVQPYEGDETMLNVMFRKQGPESLVPAMENEDETKAEKPLITQAMLKRYLRVKKEMRELGPWVRQTKKALADGVTVEQGPCTVEVRLHQIPARIPKAVVDALGLTPEEVVGLQETMGATEGKSLVIKEYGECYPFDG